MTLLDRLSEGGRNPVFYVSSSPWNLHHFLEAVFDRAGLVPGPMFLRDLGITADPAENSHGGHKGAAIDTLMEANPELPFWLLGDTGQHDAEIYLDAARRHPGRVLRVALREPGPRPRRRRPRRHGGPARAGGRGLLGARLRRRAATRCRRPPSPRWPRRPPPPPARGAERGELRTSAAETDRRGSAHRRDAGSRDGSAPCLPVAAGEPWRDKRAQGGPP